MYVASVTVRNARLRRAFVLDIIDAFATHQWTTAVLDGQCIHKFYNAFTKNRNRIHIFFMKLTTYKILRTVTTLRILQHKIIMHQNWTVFASVKF